MEIPSGFEPDLKVLRELERRADVEPAVRFEEIALIQGILARLSEGEYLLFEGALQSTLGDVYYQLPTGDRAANLEQAIVCYQNALRSLNIEVAPMDYAAVQNNMGLAYRELATGNRATNLERAIACFREALLVWTAEAAPQDYAETQANLGSAYAGLRTGDLAANLERAIACYIEALRFLTAEAAPQDYAVAQLDLGGAYARLATGDRAANLERAIACYTEALRFFTVEGDPWNYAAIQGNLGAAYAGLASGDRAANLERAIACYGEALRFRTVEAAPRDYAVAQVGLGDAYAELATGDPAANLERAIACYGEALHFLSAETAPEDYARAKAGLGGAYSRVTTGDRAANVEQAIACYSEALRFLTVEADPQAYARTQNGLGLAYGKLRTGDRAANLERAIACYTEALRFFTVEGDPWNYAATQGNLGAAYAGLASGDRAANLERAIACYGEALRSRTVEAAPQDYAVVQVGLGDAYKELRTGDRAANLERAIACYLEALRFFTVEADPREYARAKAELGGAYARRATGDRAANLEQAIACYSDALRLFTVEADPQAYAATQANMGNAYVELFRTGDRAANLERAIAYYSEALRLFTVEADPQDYAIAQAGLGDAYVELRRGDRAANLERAIACYGEALHFFTVEADPREYARTQNGLGLAYGELGTGDRAANLERAIACHKAALTVVTPEAAPADHRAVAGALALQYFRRGEWQNAHNAYVSAIRAGNLLYFATATETGRQVELADTADFVANDAYCLARLGRLCEAVERLEGGRARALAEDLARDRAALDGASAQDRTAFEMARDRIKALDAEARSTGEGLSGERVGRPFVELTEALAAARGELSGVVERIRGYVPGFMAEGLSFTEIAGSAGGQRPVVYLDRTTRGSFALVVPLGAQTLTERDVLWLDGFTSDDEVALLLEQDESGQVTGGLLAGEAIGDVERLQGTLEQALSVLGRHLMGPLVERLGELGFCEATIVPVGRLSLLPLPAAVPEDFTVAFAPSARALRAALTFAEHTASLEQVLLAVGNPLPLPEGMQPLAFAGDETEAIGLLFGPNPRVLIAREATRDSIQSSLADATHLHFACHGGFEPGEPLDSGLLLAGGERLTLRNLLDEEFETSSARLAVLSACRSGMTEYKRVPDEAIGLPAGFLQAGVPGVVSTLWPIDDVSTPLLVVEFYRLLLTEGYDPAHALSGAQKFLRISTAEQLDLANWFERRYEASGGTDADAFEDASYYRSNPEERPFEDPVYWAGFVFSGV